jgi:hypothetical protein
MAGAVKKSPKISRGAEVVPAASRIRVLQENFRPKTALFKQITRSVGYAVTFFQ